MLQNRHVILPIVSKIFLIIEVVGPGSSVKLLIISENEARHSMVEYLAAADSILIGTEVWNFIDAGMSIFCLIICAASVPHLALSELRRIRVRADWACAMSTLGKLSMIRPLKVINMGKPHPMGGRVARKSAQEP